MYYIIRGAAGFHVVLPSCILIFVPDLSPLLHLTSASL
jgi:hypothetical protein